MNLKIWNGDAPHVHLWKQLLYYDCDRAAVALVEDVFDWVVTEEQWERFTSASQKKVDAIVEEALMRGGISPFSPSEPTEEQAERKADSRRRAIEDAMVILGDMDGGKLAKWIRLYFSDRDGWRHLVLTWVEQCKADDLFGLHSDESDEL